MTRYALLSVTDKTGLVPFAAGLFELGYTILSTGGTYRALQDGGVAAVEIAEYTGFAEMMDGRVKTLHPKVHGGILGRRGIDDDVMQAHDIERIDLVAVNLYRFRETVARPDATDAEIIENIDIGGPAMIRSAAKNHEAVTVVVDPADYEAVLAELAAEPDRSRLGVGSARRLAGKAYAHTASYDCAVAAWFDEQRAKDDGEPRFGAQLALVGNRVNVLRYGENPHQAAAAYRDANAPLATAAEASLVGARQLGGKELSYNNLLDLDAALGLALEFEGPACVIVKHNNPCGVALAATVEDAFKHALAADSLSAYGGIVAFNRPLDRAVAHAMKDRGVFVEAVVAPGVCPDAYAVLSGAKWGKNVRVLSLDGVPDVSAARTTVRPVLGGFLAQTADVRLDMPDLQVMTGSPSDAQMRAMEFAWRTCKHVKSNAIVVAQALDEAGVACVTAGVGAGQMSRVDAVEIALEKAGDRARSAVLASDAFFPFADGVEKAVEAGVSAIVQPGGSKRDDEVVAVAAAANIAMVFTGQRHFRH